MPERGPDQSRLLGREVQSVTGGEAGIGVGEAENEIPATAAGERDQAGGRQLALQRLDVVVG